MRYFYCFPSRPVPPTGTSTRVFSCLPYGLLLSTVGAGSEQASVSARNSKPRGLMEAAAANREMGLLDKTIFWQVQVGSSVKQALLKR